MVTNHLGKDGIGGTVLQVLQKKLTFKYDYLSEF